jgi:protein-disulfide isomerase
MAKSETWGIYTEMLRTDTKHVPLSPKRLRKAAHRTVDAVMSYVEPGAAVDKACDKLIERYDALAEEISVGGLPATVGRDPRVTPLIELALSAIDELEATLAED